MCQAAAADPGVSSGHELEVDRERLFDDPVHSGPTSTEDVMFDLCL